MIVDKTQVPHRDPNGRLAGKVALVIGAGASAPGWGNGNATCALFAREGCTVYCVDRNETAAKQTADLIESMGQGSAYGQADATSASEIQRVVRDCIGRFGRIDILHNNVGAGVPGGVLDMEEDKWNNVLKANLNVAYLSCRATLPHMIEQGGGVIVNVSSLAAIAYMENSMAAYAAAKMGMIAMTRNLALDHVAQNIRANCIIVGTIDTAEIRRRVRTRFGDHRVDEIMALRATMPRIRRAGTPWDIAHAALFLASPEANYISGTELIVAAGDSIPIIPSYLRQVQDELGA
jgi:NAD(P)-dependent dehydrogenase (short-subunit alcohol dehydrogenase family)